MESGRQLTVHEPLQSHIRFNSNLLFGMPNAELTQSVISVSGGSVIVFIRLTQETCTILKTME